MAPSMVKLGHQPNAYRPFEVPVIYQENRIENMKQMLDALQHLENVSNAVFNRISQQVEQHKSNLASVQQRTQQASSRVSSLIGRNQATSVFSPPTYPSLSAAGGDDNQKLDHKPLFDSTNVIRVDPVYHKLNPGVSSLRNYKLVNPISLYETSAARAISEKNMQEAVSTAENRVKPEGLGPMPSTIKSISGLLLFNTGEYVYKNYPLNIDPLLGVESGEGDQDKEGLIDAPPDSLVSENHGMDDQLNQPISFQPKMRDMPELQLPTSLDLPNIIDVPWELNLDSLASIAPSSLPSLAEATGSSTAPTTAPPAPSLDGSVPPPPGPPPMTSSGGPPPPPPPGPPPPISSSGPPPPPGPPPPLPNGAPPAPPAPKTGGDDGDRGDFLASIRNFSKNKLSSSKTKRKQKEVKKPVASGGDMLADLFRKIDTRRKAIDGSGGDDRKKKRRDKGASDDESEKEIPPPKIATPTVQPEPTLLQASIEKFVKEEDDESTGSSWDSD